MKAKGWQLRRRLTLGLVSVGAILHSLVLASQSLSHQGEIMLGLLANVSGTVFSDSPSPRMEAGRAIAQGGTAASMARWH